MPDEVQTDSDVQATLRRQGLMSATAGEDKAIEEKGKIAADTEARVRANMDQRRQLTQQVGQIRGPAAPNLQVAGKPPEEHLQEPFQVYQNPLVLLATLGSLATRAPATAALNAGASAMEAQRAGDIHKYETDRQKWKDNIERIKEINEKELTKYEALWKNARLSMEEKLAQINALGADNRDEITLAGIRSWKPDALQDVWSSRRKALEAMELAELKEQGRTKLDPAIRNELQNYPGMTPIDLKDIPQASQKRVTAALESAKHIEDIANYAKESPEAYGLLAEATKKMKLDAYNSLWANKPLSKEVVAESQADREKIIDDIAKQNGYNPNAAAKAKILGKMLTTQAFSDAAAAGSRGATIYLDKAFREIYDQASTPDAFFGILEKRYNDANHVLEPYHMDFDRRSDKDNFRFWNAKAQGYATGTPSPGGIPQRPPNVPPGSAYSPSRKMWKSPSGELYDAKGQPASM